MQNMKRNTSGFTLVELLVVIAIIGILIGLLLPAVQNVREAARRTECLNNVRQIGLATASFHDSYEAFPPARLFPKWDGLPPYHRGWSEPSWFVRILPYVEQDNFYQQWNLSAPYQEQEPGEIVGQVISTFVCPARRSTSNAQAPGGMQTVDVTAPCGCGGWIQVEVVGGATGDYAGNHGDLSPGSIGAPTDFYWGGNGTGVLISSRAKEQNDGRLNWVDKIRYSTIKDGASNTILAGELHVHYDSLNTIPFNGPIYNGEDLAAFTRIGGPGVPLRSGGELPTGVLGFGSWHPGICNFVFTDGSTQSLALTTDTVTLGQMCNRADFQVQAQ